MSTIMSDSIVVEVEGEIIAIVGIEKFLVRLPPWIAEQDLSIRQFEPDLPGYYCEYDECRRLLPSEIREYFDTHRVALTEQALGFIMRGREETTGWPEA